MKSLKVAVLALAAWSAQPVLADRLGSECGLTDAKDASWISTRSINVGGDKDVAELPTLTKQQIIIAADYFAEQAGENVRFRAAADAIEYLRSSSEGRDALISYYEVRGERYTEVLHYPGGNPYGVVFATGGRRIHALNQDDTIVCR